jgi:hypothetical protein
VDPGGLEPGLLREPPQDEKCPRAGQRAALGVQEQLRPVPPIQEWPPPAQVPAERVDGAASERDDPLLASLADRADEPFLQIDAPALEADRLTDPEAGAVEQLDESAVAKVARAGPGGSFDEARGLARRERPRQPTRSPGEADVCRGVVLTASDQNLMAEERPHGGEAARDRGGGEPFRAQFRHVALELLPRRLRGRVFEESG